ncbi:hypothetical protein HmCmsJML188_02015 [Escherichia coli]|nr:hypothetical protein HmCmsJML037_04547 [Escherichia coli]GDB42817.1 hypothetical protein HmCmsJML188_02015 [Escherichia coli]
MNTIEAGDMVDDFVDQQTDRKEHHRRERRQRDPFQAKVFLYQWRRPVGEFKYYHRSNRRRQQTKEQAAGAVINQRTGKGKMPVVPHIYVNGAGFI